MRPALFLFLFLALLPACHGGSALSTCTQMACEDGLVVAFEPVLSAQGTYDIQVDLDGTTASCTAVLPFDDTSLDTCDDDRIILGLSGTALPADQQEVYELTITDTPASVHITIDQDGDPVADQDFTPTYQQVAPNGVTCGPVCNEASATLTTAQ